MKMLVVQVYHTTISCQLDTEVALYTSPTKSAVNGRKFSIVNTWTAKNRNISMDNLYTTRVYTLGILQHGNQVK